MAWPRCPRCGARPTCRQAGASLLVVDSGADTRPASDSEFPEIRFESEVYRSYRCRCGWTGLTAEKILSHGPETLCLQRKYDAIWPKPPSRAGRRAPAETEKPDAWFRVPP
jgi:hypothetical protein